MQFSTEQIEEYLNNLDDNREDEFFGTEREQASRVFDGLVSYFEEQRVQRQAEDLKQRLELLGYDVSKVTFKGK